MDFCFSASAGLIICRKLGSLPRQTLGSLPRQRLPNLAVGLSPRKRNSNIPSRSDGSNIRASLRDAIFCRTYPWAKAHG